MWIARSQYKTSNLSDSDLAALTDEEYTIPEYSAMKNGRVSILAIRTLQASGDR
jgi:hypothetical protein